MDFERLVPFSTDPEEQKNVWGYLEGLEASGLRLVEHRWEPEEGPEGTLRIIDYRTGQLLGLCSMNDAEHLDYDLYGWAPIEGTFQ